MKYSVLFTEKAKRGLKKIDRPAAIMILNWIEKNLEGCENPRLKGKPLVENHKGQWRWRIGDYRIIAEIQDDKIIILVLDIGHRREIYK
ncbi:MAG: type II toxin-antitoxin system RelE/ParE family toxin [Firmicutes bacterium]|nr:type II toxin-antitoxin system RelE/ParE family toxin [Bacillota bacterium]